ncbi:MAG TPA: glycoside hydrolase family 15 protein [Candidatus Sulfotelmatobacter sp.]|nr:glycoside hydrolase family 15 protein [Candidatus Sulfotelmatobacter sp.]
MPSPIEDYALLGDRDTAALVARNGSIDWLCLPRFDSPACFAALLGSAEHGRWKIAPIGEVSRIRRRYRDGTLILETDFETDSGAVTVIDCMAARGVASDVVRLVVGRRGEVAMRMHLAIRFDYGLIVPWVQRTEEGLTAIAGPDLLVLRCPVTLRGKNFTTRADFVVSAGEQVPFVLSWSPSNLPAPEAIDAAATITRVERSWRDWVSRCRYQGRWADAVHRSLLTLRALTCAATGGIVAAPTTSLPEQPGGRRNWDYRFCWLRDATFTLQALIVSGFTEEAQAWRDWLLRAIAGKPAHVQILYGLSGERQFVEWQVPWLPGYQGAAPVRIGNAASNQRQLDVYGEIMDGLHEAVRAGLASSEAAWNLQIALVDHLETIWDRPDDGIWEVRGGQRHFTHSKVMSWVAFDRAVRMAEENRLKAPVARWRRVRQQIHDDVCAKGFDPARGAFVQSYGSKELDASLLLLPLVGFLPPEDPRVRGTVEAIERELVVDGLVRRYHTEHGVDGLPPGEGAFLACSFWLADNLVLLGRRNDAHELFERLLDLRNDVGLLAEEFDPRLKRQLGNFPQAFSHVALVNTAHNLTRAEGPAQQRAGAVAAAAD